MIKKTSTLALGLVAAALAACAHAGDSAPGTSAYALPALAPDVSVAAVLPRNAVGENLPSVLGTVRAPHMSGEVGGFTQKRYSQSLAFPPGTKITIHNLSKTVQHTLDFVAQIPHMSGSFPKNPSLSVKAQGHGVFGPGYASGVIDPGKSVTVTLSKPGTYIIGCAFHYGIGMRDVIVIADGAKPGSQASPPSTSTTNPSPTPTSGGGGW
jgi:plastocyanin